MAENLNQALLELMRETGDVKTCRTCGAEFDNEKDDAVDEAVDRAENGDPRFTGMTRDQIELEHQRIVSSFGFHEGSCNQVGEGD